MKSRPSDDELNVYDPNRPALPSPYTGDVPPNQEDNGD